MSIASEITRLQTAKADIKAAIDGAHGGEIVPSADKIDDYADYIKSIPVAMKLTEYVTTVRKNANETANYVTNDHIRILGSDNKEYTLAQWNAMFVEAGYDKDAMTVTPVGMVLDLQGNHKEAYIFDIYRGVTYNPAGNTVGGAGRLQVGLYNHTLVTAAGSGTDITTGKGWAVTADGDELVLTEANTGCSWRIAKDTGNASAMKAMNIAERTQAQWAQTEWMRHRMAIDSGLTTTADDGTMGEIDIFDTNGDTAAVGVDMYFWINDGGWTNTGILAKYNVNNRHGVASANFTSALADDVYAAQVAAGINMNDTGANSASKPVLAPGSKGAECIAVNGKWMIITPYISNPGAVSGATNNVADAPAIYWAMDKGIALPSDTMLDAMYQRLALCQAVISYLNSVEGRGLPTIPTGDYIWSGVRYIATNEWYGYMGYGNRYYVTTYSRYFVVGASALN